MSGKQEEEERRGVKEGRAEIQRGLWSCRAAEAGVGKAGEGRR